MNFAEIFAEYWTQFRGQAESIPVFGDREYTAAIYRANSAIRKWDRIDGMLWRELITILSAQDTTVMPLASKTIQSGTVSYAAPTNMRKPPAEVWFYNGTNYSRVKVISPKEMSGLNEIASYATFIGSANTGYSMKISNALSVEYDGRLVDYLYIKKPTMFTISSTPAAQIPEMSDPNFIVQSILAGAFATARNGFGYKVADKEASTALLNMKIENSSGTYGDTPKFKPGEGWGMNTINSELGELI